PFEISIHYSSRLLWRARCRKLPASSNSHEPESEAEDCSGYCRCGSGKMQHSSQYHHSRTNQRRDRVKLGSQHGGNFHHEDVTHHTAAYPGQHAKQCRRNRPCVKRQRLTRTRYCKERESGGVEHQRSEEHTSELQSRGHLVCRLLLEKKNTAP